MHAASLIQLCKAVVGDDQGLFAGGGGVNGAEGQVSTGDFFGGVVVVGDSCLNGRIIGGFVQVKDIIEAFGNRDFGNRFLAAAGNECQAKGQYDKGK